MPFSTGSSNGLSADDLDRVLLEEQRQHAAAMQAVCWTGGQPLVEVGPRNPRLKSRNRLGEVPSRRSSEMRSLIVFGTTAVLLAALVSLASAGTSAHTKSNRPVSQTCFFRYNPTTDDPACDNGTCTQECYVHEGLNWKACVCDPDHSPDTSGCEGFLDWWGGHGISHASLTVPVRQSRPATRIRSAAAICSASATSDPFTDSTTNRGRR
jgi:hypothetical protein